MELSYEDLRTVICRYPASFNMGTLLATAGVITTGLPVWGQYSIRICAYAVYTDFPVPRRGLKLADAAPCGYEFASRRRPRA
jgi:hypothetical protein